MTYRSITDLTEIMALLRGKSPVAFDFETAPTDEWRSDPRAALDAHKSVIVGCSFATDDGNVFYVPMNHRTGRNAEKQPELWAFLKTEVFESPDVIKIAHNLAFEAMFLYAKGIVVQAPCYDTIAASQLTLKSHYEFRNLHDSGLKLLATSLFGADMPSFETVTAGRMFDEMNPQEYETIRYACADSDYTLQLYHKFNSWFDKYLPGHRTVTELLESPAAVYVGIMKYNGVPMDVPAMKAAKQHAEQEIVRLASEIQQLIGDVEIGSNCSTGAFKNYLYKTKKLPVLKQTEKFLPSVDDEAMIRLKEYCTEHQPETVPLFDLVLEYRKWQKLMSTYLDGYLNFVNAATGCIHPDLMPLATETGRFASRNPNMQNSPQPGQDPIGVRNFITAPDGWKLIEADYSQAEIRLCAYLSNDRVLLDAYRNGVDVHAITTSAVYGISLEEAGDHSNPQYKHRRTVAKSTMFGIMYGIAGAGLARNLYTNAGITLTKEECDSYIDGILHKYTDMAAWQISQKNEAADCMYVETAMGRRRYLPGIRSESRRDRSSAERMAINTPVQGLGADCLKYAMGLLVKEMRNHKDIRPILTVHDSLVFLVKETQVEEAMELIKTCMETPPPLPNFMPLVAEVSVGKRYGELE